MQTFNDATTLFWTRLFYAVCIMAELMLIDTRHTANSSNRGIRGAHLQQGCCIKVVLEFVVAISKPLRYIVAICNHPFYMEFERVAHLVNQLVV